ncbi:hypothetical protein [Streptomyces sp. NPDC127084]|uniref:hypothetical protein n=1 Tax=Streptomyces sp. NPDC127084 TaxID=3347133 RepID=UPI0036519378
MRGPGPGPFCLVGAMASAAGVGVARHSARRVRRPWARRRAAAGVDARLPDSQVHDSTGGQRSLAAGTGFPAAAAARGYRRVFDPAWPGQAGRRAAGGGERY